MGVPEEDACLPVSWHNIRYRHEPFPVEFPASPELPCQYSFLFFFVLRGAWFLLGSQQGFLFMELCQCVPGSKTSRGPCLSCLAHHDGALAPNEETKAAE